MRIIKYTYKFRLEPTEIQQVLLNKHFGSVRWTYNYFLNQRKEEYLNNKKSVNYYDQAGELTQIKKINTWLKEINSQTLQYSLKCLDMAYQGFFNKRTKFPNFKSKRNKNSFTIPQNVRYNGTKLFVPKFLDGIEMIMERQIKGLVFGGLAFKYQKQPNDIELACKDAIKFTDVACTSGPGTGKAPSIEKIKTLKHYLGDHPLAIASGVSVDNVHLYAEYVDYLMVASSITDKNEMINKDKLYQLYERIM